MAEEKTFSVGVQTSSPKRISITSNVSENPITATSDTGLYYSQLAKNWAIGEGLIQNEDYSSKTWAGESKSSADLSKMYSEAASLDLTNLENRIIEYDEQLNTTVTEGVETIETLQANSIAEITTNKESALSDITTAETNTLAQISTLANTSISDINAVGKSYDNLTYRNITNCLLEVPQRIKYDLTDGTLTIKAGSVVIVPYGTEDKTSELPVGTTFLNDNFKVYDTQYAEDAEGNGKFFVWAELVNDISRQRTGADTKERILCVYINVAKPDGALNHGSGTSSPSDSRLFYNTSTNKVEYFTNGVNTDGNLSSLPIGFCVGDGTYIYGSITQVFNGFGYIGSTVWVDKGVKGLAPYGRNEDGTYNNIERISNDIDVFTVPTTETGEFYLAFGVYGQLTYFSPNRWSYNDKLNSIDLNGSPKYGLLFAGMFTATNGVISNFNPKQPFRITDNAVSKSGDTMAGPLVINTNKDDQLRNLSLRFSSVDFATPPSSAIYPNLEFQDGQGRRMGRVEYTYKPDGSHYISINDKMNANTASYVLLYVGYDANGNAISSAPACAATNSIVTTTGIKKAANGYVKLGNGIIIQWGKSSAGKDVTVTLPIAFSSTNYGVGIALDNTVGNHYGSTVTSKTASTFKLVANYAYTNYWIAIGY